MSGGARAVNAAVLVSEVVMYHLGQRLAKEEDRNIRRGWKAVIEPLVTEETSRLWDQWRYRPETRPTEQQYLVVVYAITFEKYGSDWLAPGAVYLYRQMTHIGTHLSSVPLNKRLIPAGRTMAEREGRNVPLVQIFATSIPVAPQRPTASGPSRRPVRSGGDHEDPPVESGGSEPARRRPISAGGS